MAFSFGNTGTAAPTATGFSFGTTAATTAAPTFGTSTAPTSTFGAPAATTFGAQPATSTFGSTPATTGFGATPATTGFGAAAAPAATFGATPAAAPFSGFGTAATAAPFSSTTNTFGAQPSATPFTGFGATTTSAPTLGFGTSTASTTKPLFGPAAPLGTAPAAGAFTLAAPTSSASFGATTTTAAPFASFGQPATGGFGATLGSSAAPATTAGAQGTMNFEELETKCNEWKKELDLQEEAFLKRATQINAWDRLIINNAEMITQLNEYMKKVKSDQERMDRELDFVVAQQKELEEILVSIEKDAKTIEPLSIQHHTDVERQTTYNTATSVNAQLRAMSERIKEIIEHINATNKTRNDSSAMSQITRVLNAHMDALQFIQNGIGTLQQKAEHVSKLMGAVRT